MRIDVREGQQVAAGALLLQLELTRMQSQLAAAQAQAQQSRDALAELQAARAANKSHRRAPRWQRCRRRPPPIHAPTTNACAYSANASWCAVADVDRARAAAGNADGRVRAAQAALDELLHGTSPRTHRAGEAATAAAQAQAAVQAASLTSSTRSRRARGSGRQPAVQADQAPVGAPLAILLVGDAPHARVYVPERMRANVKPG